MATQMAVENPRMMPPNVIPRRRRAQAARPGCLAERMRLARASSQARQAADSIDNNIFNKWCQSEVQKNESKISLNKVRESLAKVKEDYYKQKLEMLQKE